jgi:hypothetical protein
MTIQQRETFTSEAIVETGGDRSQQAVTEVNGFHQSSRDPIDRPAREGVDLRNRPRAA